MTARAKFVCYTVAEYTSTKEVKMHAVHSETGENKDFTEASPAGELDITIWKEKPAANFFKPGKEYYLDFSEAPAPEVIK